MQTLEFVLKSCICYPWSKSDILGNGALVLGSMYPWPAAGTSQFARFRSRVYKFETYLNLMKKINSTLKHLGYIKENKIQLI